MLRELARSKLGLDNVCVNVAFCAFGIGVTLVNPTIFGGTDYRNLALSISSSCHMAGLANIDVRVGETALIAPATGWVGSGAVHIAAAMGVVSLLWGISLAQVGPLDVLFDIPPASVKDSSYFQAGIASLRPGGRVSLMGVFRGGVEFPYSQIITTHQAKDLIKLIEKGILKIESGSDMKATGKFGSERWDEAFKASATKSGLCNAVYFVPNENGLC
ncbi:hypothetical protein M434DRAFT_35172 [Hypoxylon sp. CO27-5]|nr:hypothetical protein M434DRAFT_35172 [Hypoxylon sp. CO27-5]